MKINNFKHIIAKPLVKRRKNLAKQGDGLDKSPTVMVGDKTTKQPGKNRGILKPS